MILESEIGKRKRLIAGLLELDHGKALMEELSYRIDKLQEKVEQGRLCDDNFRNDIRWQLGKLSALRDIQNLPKNSLEWLEAKGGKGNVFTE